MVSAQPTSFIIDFEHHKSCELGYKLTIVVHRIKRPKLVLLLVSIRSSDEKQHALHQLYSSKLNL
jgi:hypothetical protein